MEVVQIYIDLPDSGFLIFAIGVFSAAALVSLWKYVKRVVI